MLERGQHLADASKLRHIQVREPHPVALLGARTSTRPHGSTAIELPYERRPFSGSPNGPHCPGATTKHWFSIARARRSTSQWSVPVACWNCAGTNSTSAPIDHQTAVQLREAQVIADREADPADVGLVRDELVARCERRRFAERRLTRQVHVEQVDLPVRRDQFAVPIEQDRRRVPMFAVELDDAAAQHPHLSRAGDVGEALCRRTGDRLGGGGSAGGRAEIGEHLGKRGKVGVAVRGLTEESLGEGDVRLDVVSGTHLTQGNAHRSASLGAAGHEVRSVPIPVSHRDPR